MAGLRTAGLLAFLSATCVPHELALVGEASGGGGAASPAGTGAGGGQGLGGDGGMMCTTQGPAPPAPLLDYLFEGTAENDGALEGYDGSATSVGYVAGRHGSAIQFDATEDSLMRVTDTDEVLSGLPAFTISVWFREPEALRVADPRYLIHCRTGSATDGFEIYRASAPTLTACWGNGSNGGGCFAIPYQSTVWHHLALRFRERAAPAVDRVGQALLDGMLVKEFGEGEALLSFADIELGRNGNFEVDELRVYGAELDDVAICVSLVGGSWCDNECIVN